MPYTFVHPGFFYPLRRWKPQLFSTTGWIFGSIAPDYAFLLRLTNPRFHLFQYDWKSILFIVFPMALFSAIYFHKIIRNILIDAAPEQLKEQLIHYKSFRFGVHLKEHWLSVVISVFLAIILHLLLDLTVHFNANTFKMIAWNYYGNFWSGIMYYYLAMYFPAVSLSLLGAYYIYLWISSESVSLYNIGVYLKHEPSRQFLLLYSIFAFFFFCLKIFMGGIEKGYALDVLVIGATNGLLISFFVTPGILYIYKQIAKDGQQ